MASVPSDLLSSALALPPRERARLAHELLTSLDQATDADAADAWVAELELRSTEARAGAVAPEDWSAIRDRLSDRWSRR
ncbi:MAG: addiction module protein [Anaeromyxobacteraceae bacterium]